MGRLLEQSDNGARHPGGDACPGRRRNTVSYVIHRLCDATGAPHLTNCSKPPAGANAGGSFSAGGASVITTNQVYYRITTRIVGPRRTVAYIQTIIAL